MPDPVCETDLKFKSVTSITNDFLLNILEANFKMFLDWSFVIETSIPSGIAPSFFAFLRISNT